MIVEFGVELRTNTDDELFLVPVDSSVQVALLEMVDATRKAMSEVRDKPHKYDPAEKYTSPTFLHLPVQNDIAEWFLRVHQSENWTQRLGALNDHRHIFCYLARITYEDYSRVTAIRRASYFKGMLKKRLVAVMSGALRMVEDTVFKLDRDFDVLIEADDILILRPSPFEAMGHLRQAVLNAVPSNVARIKKKMPFVQFDNIQEYAETHVRAARYLCSIHEHRLGDIDKDRLMSQCRDTLVEVSEVDGQVVVDKDNVSGFLQILDRRRWAVSLVKEAPEAYSASSRQRIG